MKGSVEAQSPLDVGDADVQKTPLDTQSDTPATTYTTEEESSVPRALTIVSLPTPEPLPRPKPTWWSEPWDMLDGIQPEESLGYLTPMCGAEFRFKCESDIHAIDLYCTRSIIDPITGESRLAEVQDDENQVVAGVMWCDEPITLSAVYGKGYDPNGLYLSHQRRMLDICPAGRGITLRTTSALFDRRRDEVQGTNRKWIPWRGMEPDSWSVKEHLGTYEHSKEADWGSEEVCR
jgi:hypothetical protein